jgi:hypothetical protein
VSRRSTFREWARVLQFAHVEIAHKIAIRLDADAAAGVNAS